MNMLFEIIALSIVSYCLHAVHPMLCAAFIVYNLANIVSQAVRAVQKANQIKVLLKAVQEKEKDNDKKNLQ